MKNIILPGLTLLAIGLFVGAMFPQYQVRFGLAAAALATITAFALLLQKYWVEQKEEKKKTEKYKITQEPKDY